MKKDDAIFNVLREYIKQSKKILLKLNDIKRRMEVEAAKEVLSNFKSTLKH
jgi:glutamine synthetase